MTDAQLWYEDLKTFSNLDHCIVEGLLKNKRWISFSFLNHQLIREGVKKPFFGTLPQTSEPTHPQRTFGTPLSERWKLCLFCFLGCLEHFIFFLKKWEIFWTKFQNSKIFGALKHHEMARYDLPTYVLHVLGHFWMFAVKITEWIFSLKSLGLWTWTWTHLTIVWDKVPNKFGFFFTPSLIMDIDFQFDSYFSHQRWLQATQAHRLCWLDSVST